MEHWLRQLLGLLALSLGQPAAASGALCPSYAGKQCAAHGHCVTTPAGAKCVCESGYISPDCSVADFCPGDCSGRGRCVQPPPHVKMLDPGAPGVCECEPDFGGADCNTVLVQRPASEASARASSDSRDPTAPPTGATTPPCPRPARTAARATGCASTANASAVLASGARIARTGRGAGSPSAGECCDGARSHGDRARALDVAQGSMRCKRGDNV